MCAKQLQQIKGVGPSTVEQLNNAGLESVDDVAQSSIDELIEDAGLTKNKASSLYSECRQNAVLLQTGAEVESEYNEAGHVPSGLDPVDSYLGGGWEEGFLIAFTGSDGAGKTQLSFWSLVNAVESTGNAAVYIETERKRFRPERIREMAESIGADGEEILSKIYRVPAYSLDQQFNSYSKIAELEDDLSVVVIDSFTARFRLTDEFDGRQNLRGRSEEMAKHLTELERITENQNLPILITGQVYGSPDMYAKQDNPYGGSLFGHTITFRVALGSGKGDTKQMNILNHPGQADKTFALDIDDKLVAIEDD